MAFLWGSLAASVMVYYAGSWTLYPENPLRHETGIGFGIGLLYGFPAWLGLPALAYHGRSELRCIQQVLLLSPLLVAIAATTFLGFKGAL